MNFKSNAKMDADQRGKNTMTQQLIAKTLMVAVFGYLLVEGSSAAYASSTPESFADIAEKLTPTVVNISTTQVVDRDRAPEIPKFPPGSPFEDFFREFFDERGEKNDDSQPRRRRRATSLGSGFIIDKEGYVVTNNHVIEDADEITVTLHDDTRLEAKVIGRDPKVDIAILKIETDIDLPTANWGDSDKTRVGDWVVAIGNPFGLGGTVTAGIVSARARTLNGTYDDYIQTDASINRGNSGGPLFNLNGEVVGVNTAIYSPTGGSVGIGFASPSNLVSRVLSDLREFGKPRRGWLGVKIQDVTEEIAESLGLDRARGALVAEVVGDSPADKAGVQSSDVILAFDGKEVKKMRELPRIVAETNIGKNIGMVVWRDGVETRLQVSVGELDEDEVVVASRSNRGDRRSPQRKEIGELGLIVAELTDDVRDRYELPEGASGLVVVDVDGDSDAAQKGLRPGDIIDEIQQTPVDTAEAARSVINQAKNLDRSVVLLRVQSGENVRFVPLKIEG